MGHPLRIERIGVDAKPLYEGLAFNQWLYVGESNGLRVGVHRNVDCTEDDGEMFSWSVSLGWRDIVLRGETSDDLDDAFDAAMEHAHVYVPKLWSVVYDLVEAEKARRQNELARLDREAEGADEEAQ